MAIRDDDSQFVVNQVDAAKGLADLPARQRLRLNLDLGANLAVTWVKRLYQAVVSGDSRAWRTIRHPAPFACVLGNQLFEECMSHQQPLVLPADRVTPLLKGGPLCCAREELEANTGIVVSLAGNAVDIVVGTPPTVQFLQRIDRRQVPVSGGTSGSS